VGRASRVRFRIGVERPAISFTMHRDAARVRVPDINLEVVPALDFLLTTTHLAYPPTKSYTSRVLVHGLFLFLDTLLVDCYIFVLSFFLFPAI
jgi:hypothetical protein